MCDFHIHLAKFISNKLLANIVTLNSNIRKTKSLPPEIIQIQIFLKQKSVCLLKREDSA